MNTSNLAPLSNAEHPRIVLRADWLAARQKLLDKEKELTRYRDAVKADFVASTLRTRGTGSLTVRMDATPFSCTARAGRGR